MWPIFMTPTTGKLESARAYNQIKRCVSVMFCREYSTKLTVDNFDDFVKNGVG